MTVTGGDGSKLYKYVLKSINTVSTNHGSTKSKISMGWKTVMNVTRMKNRCAWKDSSPPKKKQNTMNLGKFCHPGLVSLIQKKRHLRWTCSPTFKKTNTQQNKKQTISRQQPFFYQPCGPFLVHEKKRKPPESVGPATFKRTRSPSTTWIKPAIIPRIIGFGSPATRWFLWGDSIRDLT